MEDNNDGLIVEGAIPKQEEPVKENTAAPSTEKTELEQTPPTEGVNTQPEENLPFHKHPRWKALYAENQAMHNTLNEVLPIVEEFKRSKDSAPHPQPSATVPQWFQTLYGDNLAAWNAYSTYTAEERARMKQDVLNEIKQEEQKSKQEVARWDQWIDEQINTLKEDGKQFDRNKLLKVVNDYRPTDDAGRFDFNRAYEIYQVLESKEGGNTTIQARKNLADQTTKSAKPADPKEKTVFTPKDTRRTRWTGLLD